MPGINAIFGDDWEDGSENDFENNSDNESLHAKDWEPYLEDPGYMSPKDV